MNYEPLRKLDLSFFNEKFEDFLQMILNMDNSSTNYKDVENEEKDIHKRNIKLNINKIREAIISAKNKAKINQHS